MTEYLPLCTTGRIWNKIKVGWNCKRSASFKRSHKKIPHLLLRNYSHVIKLLPLSLASKVLGYTNTIVFHFWMKILCKHCQLQQPVIRPPRHLPPDPHSTGHLWLLLWVVGPREDRPMSPFQVEPNRTPWTKARWPGTCLQTLSPGLAPGQGPGTPLSRVHKSLWFTPHLGPIFLGLSY